MNARTLFFNFRKRDGRQAQATEAVGGFLSRWSMLGAKSKEYAKLLCDALTFSLFQGIVTPQRSFCVSLKNRSVWIGIGSRLFSKIEIKAMKNVAFQEGQVPSAESVASAVCLAAKELMVSGTDVTLSIPQDWVVVRTMSLPVTVKETIGRTIGYELDRLTPFKSENAYYDFKILGEKDGRIEIVVIAVRSDNINPYLAALRNEGISVARLTTNAASLGALCSYMGHPDSVCVEADDTRVSIGVIRNKILISSFGHATSEEDERTRKGSMIEFLKPIVESARDYIPEVHIVIAGSERADRNALQTGLNVPVLNLAQEDIKRRFLTGREAAISCVVAGTIVESLWPRARRINLLRRGTNRKARRPVFISLILILLILSTWLPHVIVPLRTEQERLQEIEWQISIRKGEVRKVEALRKEIKDLNSEIDTITGFKEGAPMALVILKELTSTLPKNVWLTRIRMTERTVDLEGYATSASEVLPKLEQSKHLKKAEFASPTVRDSRTNSDRFVIKTEIEGTTVGERGKTRDEQKK